MTYATRLRALLSPAERRVFAKLNSPQKIQDFLDHFPVKYFPKAGEPDIKSPRQALVARRMHCMEGALVAAAALAYHGHEPLLMDIQSAPYDYDHVVALFKQRGHWGAISKTGHPVLRWRDPVYKTPRELAMSYFNEYFWPDKGRRRGLKTMRAYSRPFNLERYAPERWVTAAGLDWLAEALDKSPHYPAVPRAAENLLRRANDIEIKAVRLNEWPHGKKK